MIVVPEYNKPTLGIENSNKVNAIEAAIRQKLKLI
jgi:hypothetical protein